MGPTRLPDFVRDSASGRGRTPHLRLPPLASRGAAFLLRIRGLLWRHPFWAGFQWGCGHNSELLSLPLATANSRQEIR